MKQSINKFDQSIIQWVSSTFGQAARPFFEFMTMLGDPISIFLITTAIIAAGVYTSNIRLAISGAVIPVTLFTGFLLKMSFERARPLTEYAMNMKIKTYSFPSGHSSGSTIAFGLLAYFAFTKLPAPWNYIVGGVLALVPLFVGISRVYLGAHFPSDVIAGWALGLIALAIVIFVVKPLL
jgi:undecaprenyl-diphosphatase